MPPFSWKRLAVASACLVVALATSVAYGVHVQLHGVPPVALSAFVLAVQVVGIGTSVGLLFGRNSGLAAAAVLLIVEAMSI